MSASLLPTAIPNTPPCPRAAREVRRNTPLRQARSCYTHLAGTSGVTLLDHLLGCGWIEEAGISRGRLNYRLTPRGTAALSVRGVELPSEASSRRFAYGCVDWTERRYHLAGPLGAAIRLGLFNAGYISQPTPFPDDAPGRRGAGRVIVFTRPLETWLDGVA